MPESEWRAPQRFGRHLQLALFHFVILTAPQILWVSISKSYYLGGTPCLEILQPWEVLTPVSWVICGETRHLPYLVLLGKKDQPDVVGQGVFGPVGDSSGRFKKSVC